MHGKLDNETLEAFARSWAQYLDPPSVDHLVGCVDEFVQHVGITHRQLTEVGMWIYTISQTLGTHIAVAHVGVAAIRAMEVLETGGGQPR